MPRYPLIEKIIWGGWPNCYRISNGEAELVVTADVGPRIMHYGFAGGQNFFKVFEDQLGKCAESDWQFRGGHRVWLAPESFEETYAPDNGPVGISVVNDTFIATQPVEPSTGIEKQLVIRMSPNGTRVTVNHRMRNTRAAPRNFAVWALSMMAQDGVAVTGFPPRGLHENVLAPTNPLVMWAFTDLSDPRWTFLHKYLVLRHDRNNSAHTKLGLFNTDTWGAYLLHGEVFLKTCSADASKPYPDMGCSYETFASADMLEIETLGPMTTVRQGEWAEHREHWSLFRGCTITQWSDDELDAALLPLLAPTERAD